MITCLGDTLLPRMGMAAAGVLQRLGVQVGFPRSQACCGQVALNSGYPEEARRMALATITAFRESPTVVGISGSCVAMARHQYPLMFEGTSHEAEATDLAARTYEFSEYLVHVLGVTELPATLHCRATLHHSCHTQRVLGVEDEPARLLQMVEGLELIPLPRARDCCGFGGTFAVIMPDVSASMAAEKAEHVLETRAQVLVGLDPSCLLNIGGLLARCGSAVRVLHLAELLDQAWRR